MALPIHLFIREAERLKKLHTLDYISATELAQRIRDREVSSVEALEHFIGRTQVHNGKLNAVVATQYEVAGERAQAADAALANGENWGALHGVPMTIKDSYEVVGMPTTSGAPELQHHRSKTNADAVQAFVDAGANVFGKTNLPLYAGDWQSYNEIYGTTNNPWDLTRTPGGSSGGAAAAVAAGMSPIELGSDIGGSIRIPAHYCGIYGHKPTQGIISLRGHIPGEPGSLASPDLAVGGPLSTTPADLKLLLDLLVGTMAPRRTEAGNLAGWHLKLPTPRHTSLKSLRIAYWFDDTHCTIDKQMRQQYMEVVSALQDAGAMVTEARPAGYTLTDSMAVYLPLLASILGAGVPRNVYRRFPILAKVLRLQHWVKGLISADIPAYLEGMTLSHREWLRVHELRTQMQHHVSSWFADYDVLLTPIVPTPAIVHNQKGEVLMRSIQVNGQERAYADHVKWISLATALGLPATSAPVGRVNNLPINMQIIGAAFHDYTTIAFAEQLQSVMGGFTPPPLS